MALTLAPRNLVARRNCYTAYFHLQGPYARRLRGHLQEVVDALPTWQTASIELLRSGLWIRAQIDQEKKELQSATEPLRKLKELKAQLRAQDTESYTKKAKEIQLYSRGSVTLAEPRKIEIVPLKDEIDKTRNEARNRRPQVIAHKETIKGLEKELSELFNLRFPTTIRNTRLSPLIEDLRDMRKGAGVDRLLDDGKIDGIGSTKTTSPRCRPGRNCCPAIHKLRKPCTRLRSYWSVS
jgi:hypothetical protein